MKRKSYFFKVVTPLHVGAGQGLSYVDLPIVREVHTKFPYVPGSSLKGAIRDYYLRSIAEKYGISKVSQLDGALTKNEWNGLGVEEKDRNFLVKAFGTAGEAEQGGSGKINFTDARLLFFPVRSLKGIFLLITCPYAINRYYRDMGMRAHAPQVGEDLAIVSSSAVTLEGMVMLEEFVFRAQEEDWFKSFLKTIPEEAIKGNEHRLVCVSDTLFADFVQSYTEVQTHVKIDPDTGTVATRALWTTEYIPAESLLYVNLFFEEEMEFSLPSSLWLGGDVTTGKGLVKVVEVRK